MRLKILTAILAIFNPASCYKESMGYRCKHGNHNDIRECDGKRI